MNNLNSSVVSSRRGGKILIYDDYSYNIIEGNVIIPVENQNHFVDNPDGLNFIEEELLGQVPRRKWILKCRNNQPVKCMGKGTCFIDENTGNRHSFQIVNGNK